MHTSLLRWALLVCPHSDRSLDGAPEDLVRGVLDGQVDIMKRPPGYVMNLGIIYRGVLYDSIVAKGRPWKTTGRQPEPRDALLLWKEA